eukprot:3895316-Pyramimonas_sp.AAC.1
MRQRLRGLLGGSRRLCAAALARACSAAGRPASLARPTRPRWRQPLGFPSAFLEGRADARAVQ